MNQNQNLEPDYQRGRDRLPGQDQPSRRGRAPQRPALLALLAPAVLSGALAVLAVAPGRASAAAATKDVTLTASIGGMAVAHSTSAHPVVLHPSRSTAVNVVVSNPTAQAVTIQSVDISGQVVGLKFFSYVTSVNLDVAAGSQSTVGYTLNTTSLSGQATGLIPGSVQVLDGHGKVVAAEAMVADVHGSLASVYGLFGLAIFGLTALAVADVLVAVARHRLPENRWRRGLGVATPGIGLGFVLVFTMSALGLWAPTAGTWLTIFVVFAAAFFVAGYLTPTPLSDREDHHHEDDIENGDLDDDTLVAVGGDDTAVVLTSAVRGLTPTSAGSAHQEAGA